MTDVYYNENEPFACEWLKNLARAGHLPHGAIDSRSIVDIEGIPDDVVQAHFFAGIGGWPLALRLAGWPDGAEVWTGSCPCQPFSAAGRGRGFNDERHLWPEWFRLIRECGPPTIFGEQVASPAGRAWLDLVFADLEGAGYACGAANLCAAGVGAPHIRQRLYWVAYTAGARWRWARRAGGEELPHEESSQPRRHGEARQTLAHAAVAPFALQEALRRPARLCCWCRPACRLVSPGWNDCEWVSCRDPKRGVVYRPVEPGAFPLAHGVPGRVGRLRAYGNAVVPQVAATFVRAVIGTITGVRDVK